MAALLAIILSSFVAMVKIFLICLVGVIAAKYPKDDVLLPASSLRMLSRLSNIVFLPALIIVSFGSSLNMEMLGRIGILIFYCGVINVISYLIAHTLGKVLHEKNAPGLFTASAVCIGSPNAIALPLVVFQTLCQEHTINVDYDSDEETCFKDASAMLFVYSIGWHLMFWSYGFPMLKKLSPEFAVNTVKSEESDASTLIPEPEDSANPLVEAPLQNGLNLATLKKVGFQCYEICTTPSMVGIFIGCFVAFVPPFQEMIFDKHLKFLGDVLITLGDPLIAIFTLVMAASLAHTDLSYFEKGIANISSKGGAIIRQLRGKFLCGGISGADLDCNGKEDHGSEKDIVVNDDFGMQKKRSEIDDGPGLETENSFTALVMESTESHPLPSWRTVATHLLCRLILPPIIIFPVIMASRQVGLLTTGDRLMTLVIIIESASPSAQILIVSINQLGIPAIASAVAYIYVFQYIFSVFTITLWTSVGIWFIYS